MGRNVRRLRALTAQLAAGNDPYRSDKAETEMTRLPWSRFAPWRRSGQSTNFRAVKYEVKDGIAIITRARPKVLNAVNFQTHCDIIAAFEEAENDDSVLYVVLTGEGRFFCSGADVAGNKEDWGAHDDPPRVQEIKSVLSQQDPYDSNVRALCPSSMACNLTYLCCYCVRLGATWRCTTPGSISANHW